MLALTRENKRRPVLPSFLQRCRTWLHSATIPLTGAQPDQTGNPLQGTGCDPAAWPRRSTDTQLLFQCMATLQLDREELASEEPALLRELQGLCAVCRSKQQCILDLACGFDPVVWERWREYCPNAATLSMLGAIRNCGLAARHLDAPHPTGSPGSPENH